MGMFKYMTNRTLPNKAGAETGRLRVVVRAGSETAEVDYTCPECKKTEHVETPWKRPFSIKCNGCGCVMKSPKLKGKK